MGRYLKLSKKFGKEAEQYFAAARAAQERGNDLEWARMSEKADYASAAKTRYEAYALYEYET